MELFLCILLVVGGLLLIIKGADWFVDSAVWIATKLKVSPVIIGATIVSVGTTLIIITATTTTVQSASSSS